MTYDLRREPWIPWRRRSGVVEWGPPAMLVDRMADDPVVALAAPRPDFDGALQEFLIGLLTVALQAEDESAWRRLWDGPPTRDALQSAIDSLPPAFHLDGDGPRFFQDSSMAECRSGAAWCVESLLIDTAGTTVKDGARPQIINDLFMKPGRVMRISRPAAAMALLTMQTYAPEGGRGHLTSMRGGGPLTTLVEPRVDEHDTLRAHEQPLWYKLWANVETLAALLVRAPAGGVASASAVFPWLAATRAASEPKTETTTPGDVHPAQAYFGLPRRIRLEFTDAGRCDVTGMDDDVTVTTFWMRGPGTKYTGWRHPLSPYYRAKGEWFPVHGSANGLAWRDWLGMTLWRAAGSEREPATAVATFQQRARTMNLRSFRLHAFGYDMEHKKSVGWTDALMPGFRANVERQALIFSSATQFGDGTAFAANILRDSVKAALFQRPKDAPGNFVDVRGALWIATTESFFDAMRRISDADLTEDDAEQAEEALRRAYATRLPDHATEVFDRWCPAAGLAPEPMRRRVTARYNLLTTLRGYSKLGEKLFLSLGVAPPGGGHAARVAMKTRSRKEATR